MLFTWVITTPAILLSFSIIIIRTVLTLASTNWITIWIIIELNLLRFIPLIIKTKSSRETEAAIKYFLAQALGSAAILLRRLSIWHFYSTTIEIILLSALLLKIGAAPFHFWYPSAITALPWITSLYLSTWQKLAPLAVLLYIIASTLTNLLLIIARVNSLVGGIIGINQSHIRTIIAYSSIGHIGWIIALVRAHNYALTILYFSTYVIILIPVFTLIVTLNIETAEFLSHKLITYKILALSLPLLLLSIGGIPPLTGFLPKLLTIVALVKTAPITLIILILGSMLNLYFYLTLRFSFIAACTKISADQKFSYKGCKGYRHNLAISRAAIGFIPIII